MDVTPPSLVHKVTAEAVGTLILVVATCAAAIDSDSGVDVLSAAFVLVALTYAFTRLTGGHFNPAVTLGSVLSGRTAWSEAGPYIGAQMVGGLLAGLLLMIFGLGGSGFEVFETPLGTNSWGDDGTGYAVWAAVLLTLVATAFFVLMWLALTDKRNEHVALAPLGIGLALYAALSITQEATGGTVNPAQSLGTAVFSGGDPLIQVWVFILGPVLGAAAAGFLYPVLFGADRDAVAGSGLSFSSGSSSGGGYAMPGGYEQQWGPQGGQPVAPMGGQAGYPQQGYDAPSPAPAAAAPAPVEQPIIQDGWQWDPATQQWIPAQQQQPAPPAAGSWPNPATPGAEQTQVRPPDGF